MGKNSLQIVPSKTRISRNATQLVAQFAKIVIGTTLSGQVSLSPVRRAIVNLNQLARLVETALDSLALLIAYTEVVPHIFTTIQDLNFHSEVFHGVFYPMGLDEELPTL